MENRFDSKTSLILFGACFLFFLLLFIQFPINGNLPGNADTWLVGITIPNALRIKFLSLFTGLKTGTSMFPENFLAFGETAPGCSVIFSVFRIITRDDIVAYYFFISVLFSINAFGAAALARAYGAKTGPSVVAGFAFSCSNFIIANIDTPQTTLIGVAALGLAALKRYFANNDKKELYKAAVLGGIQAYFSAYVFLFFSVAAIIITIFEWKKAKKQMIKACGLFMIIAVPFFTYYFINIPKYFNPWDSLTLPEIQSLEPGDLFRPLPGNIVYPERQPLKMRDLLAGINILRKSGYSDLKTYSNPLSIVALRSAPNPDEEVYYSYTRKCANIGIILYLFAALTLWKGFSGRNELLIIFFVCLAVAMGPLIRIGNHVLPTPTYPLYRYFDLAGYLRVPLRIFSISVLAVSVLASRGISIFLDVLAKRSLSLKKYSVIITVCIGVFILLENIPFPLPSFEGKAFARPPAELMEFAKEHPESVWLNLPSRIGGGFKGDTKDLFEYNREIIYMNWQTYHHQNIVNGVNGYFPYSRIFTQEIIENIPDANAIKKLVAMGVDYIVFNKKMVLENEKFVGTKLKHSNLLRVILDTESVTVYGFNKQKSGN